jgi:nucleotide-binding universal stress UspA family protein
MWNGLRHDLKGRADMFNSILLCADGSQHSIRAAEKAIELAMKSKIPLEIAYVISGATSKSDVLYCHDKSDISQSRQAKLKMIQEQCFVKKIPYQIHLLRGEPGPTIVQFANKQAYDCVILGSRGLNPFQSMVLGSVSHKVAKRVNCPVLLVK